MYKRKQLLSFVTTCHIFTDIGLKMPTRMFRFKQWFASMITDLKKRIHIKYIKLVR